METVQRIAKNTAILLLSDILSKIFGFFYVIYTARYLGAEGFGVLSFAIAFTGIFGVFTDLGLKQLTIREVARDKSLTRKFLGNILVIKLVLTTITFVIIALLINFLNYSEKTIIVVYLLTFSVIITAFSQVFNSIFQAYEKMEFFSGWMILHSSLLLLGTFYAIVRQFDVIGFAFIYSLASIFEFGYCFIILIRRFVKPKIEVDWQFWKITFREALPFGLSNLFGIIYYYIDSVMLSLMKGNEVVGLYNASYRLVYVLLFIPVAFFTSFYPVMSRLYKLSENSMRFAYVTSLRYMAIIAYPIALGIILFAHEIVVLVFKEEYIPSIPALQILVWAVFFAFLSYATVHTLNSIDRQRIYTQATFLGMVLNVLLNLVFIPPLSFIGASITTVITECVAFLFMFYYLERYFGKTAAGFVARFGVVSLLLLPLPFILTPLGAVIPFLITCMTYFTLLYFLGLLTIEDVNFFKNIFISK